MKSAEESFLDGLSLHRDGRSAEAEACYARTLEIDPGHFKALQHLGALCADRGARSEAADLFEKAARSNPSDPVIHYQLASMLAELGRFEESLAAYDAAIALRADIPLLHAGRGSALHALKRHDDAIAAYDRALALKPHDALTHANRASVLQIAGRSDEALAAIDRALALVSDDAKSHVIRGFILLDLGEEDKALAEFGRAIFLGPDSVEVYLRFGAMLSARGEYAAAEAALSDALRRYPDCVEAYVGRGGVRYFLQDFENAVADCSKAIALDPNYAVAYHNRANALMDMNRLDEALADSDKALALAPEMTAAAVTRFTITANRCDWSGREQAVADLKRHYAASTRALPFPLLYAADDPELHLAAAKSAAGPARRQRPQAMVHQRLRIGYLSPDFCDHVVAHQLVETLEHHDHSGFETLGISLVVEKTPMRERLMKTFDRFVEAAGRSDPDLATLIAGLNLDIVVDLAGYTTNGRSKVLAWQPAPLAVTWLGYPGTLGADYVDYIIADATVIPPAAEAWYSEKIVRLPGSFMPRDTTVLPAEPPSRSAAGLPEQGLVFGAFANGYKIEPALFDVWMRLLEAVPGSILWLNLAAETARGNLRREAAARGINPERLIFAARIFDRADYLGRLRLIDLYLDTVCYGAHATTSDMLWAGVPVLSVMGKSFATRVAASMLRTTGLDELVTADLGSYERTALALANDPARLAALRARLATTRRSNPLFDMTAHCRHLEAAYRTMVERLRQGRPPESFAVPLSAEDSV